jgi:hypothetical protein
MPSSTDNDKDNRRFPAGMTTKGQTTTKTTADSLRE